MAAVSRPLADPAHAASSSWATRAATIPRPAPIFAYIYNSFGTVILREVLSRLETCAAQGDPVVIVYVNPLNRSAFEDGQRWRVAADRSDWVLYTPAC
ncbi:MAG: hypothetical protein K0R56_308 [Sphingomonas sp.]|nr:hypothetical protein [Sphingomonas sp.]